MSELTVRLFARPEDHSAKTAYESHPWVLYATSTDTTVSIDKLKGRCHVALNDSIKAGVHLTLHIISSSGDCLHFIYCPLMLHVLYCCGD